LDRFYISHSEADLDVVKPIAYSVTSFLTRWASSESSRAKGFNGHIPVALRFLPISTKNNAAHRIVDETMDSDLFIPLAEKQYFALCDDKPNASPMEMLELLKNAIRFASMKVKRTKKDLRTRLALFQRATALYRKVTSKDPRDEDVLRLTKDFPVLNGLLSRSASGWDSRDLKSFIDKTYSTLGSPDKNFGRGEESLFTDPPPLQNEKKGLNAIRELKLTLPSTRSKVKALRASLADDPTDDPLLLGPIIAKHYKQVWKKAPSADEECMEEYLEEYDRRIDPSLIKEISLETILQAIDMAPNTSPGPDGIPFKAYKLLRKTAAPVLLAAFKFLSREHTDVQIGDFNFASLFLIPKKDTYLVDDTRPISCNNTCNRIIARAAVLCVVDASQKLIGQYQKMFLPGRQMTDHIRALNELYYKAVQSDDSSFLLFMDNRKAFDSIHHDFIIATLKKQGFPAWFIALVINLLTNVSVFPSLAPDARIGVERGVKQGCPLSPLLFILVYDVLHFKLSRVPRLRVLAAADDLAANAESLETIVLAFPVIDCYSKLSGLGINRDKTALLSAKDPRGAGKTIYDHYIPNSAWPGVLLVDEHRYLGIKFGRNIQTGDIFKAPLEKAISRAKLFQPTIRRLSVQKRILIFNVFITTIFSFVQQFYVMPSDVYQSYTSVMLKMINPWNGSAWPYSQLVAPLRSGGFRQPLVDPWVYGTSMLLRHVDFASITSEALLPWALNMVLPADRSFKSLNYDSPVLSDHRNLALMEFLGDEYLCWDGTTALSIGRKDIKRVALKHGILSYSGPRCSAKNSLRKDFCHHLLDRYSAYGSPAASNMYIHFDKIPKQTPAIMITVFIKALCNALNTDSRFRHVKKDCSTHLMRTHLNPYPCYLCGEGGVLSRGDSTRHVFLDCQVVKDAFRSVLISPEGPADPSFRSIYDKKTTPLFILDFPVAKPTLGYSRLCLCICAIFSVWNCRVEIKKGRDCAGVVPRIVNRILSERRWWSVGASTATKYGSASSRSAEQKLACHVDSASLIASLPGNAVVVYTDGSAIGNPGPAGAGAYITSPNFAPVSLLQPLGVSTNNLGEMWAVGMALEFILSNKDFRSIWLSPIYILSDSLFTISTIEKGYSQQTRLEEITRSIILLLGEFKTRIPKFYWVPGHSGVPGNEVADSLATRASELSRCENISVASCLDPFTGVFSCSVPLH
jgi:ribonuclease HI